MKQDCTFLENKSEALVTFHYVKYTIPCKCNIKSIDVRKLRILYTCKVNEQVCAMYFVHHLLCHDGLSRCCPHDACEVLSSKLFHRCF
jgi:hypothetical protein